MDVKKAIIEEKNAEMSAEDKTAAIEAMTDEDVIAYYLQKHPEVKGVFGTNNVTTQLAVSALEKAEKSEEIIVMGFDAGKDQIQDVRAGKIAGLVVQNPFAIGYVSVIASARTVLQVGNEAVVNVGYTWVTKENLESESIQHMVYE